jgi:hypothetical protein
VSNASLTATLSGGLSTLFTNVRVVAIFVIARRPPELGIIWGVPNPLAREHQLEVQIELTLSAALPRKH